MTSSDEVCGDMLYLTTLVTSVSATYTAETAETRPLNPCTCSRDVGNEIHKLTINLCWV